MKKSISVARKTVWQNQGIKQYTSIILLKGLTNFVKTLTWSFYYSFSNYIKCPNFDIKDHDFHTVKCLEKMNQFFPQIKDFLCIKFGEYVFNV